MTILRSTDSLSHDAPRGTEVTPVTSGIGAGLAGLDFERPHVRFGWSPNAIAIWDNRGAQHHAVGDDWPAPCTMERVSIAGGVLTR